MIKAVGVLTKAVKILQFIGLAIGPIIDVINNGRSTSVGRLQIRIST